jgi:membrane fusion protein (multidrug efflux system)
MHQFNFQRSIFKKHQQEREYKWIGICIGWVIICCACGNGKGPKGGMGGPHMKATVLATTVTPMSYTIDEKFPANLIANNVVELRPDVTGYLQAIKVKDGSHVKRGQVLYEIDATRYVAAYNQVQASLQQAQADLALKQRDLERYQELLKHDAISRQTVDQAATAVKTAQANVAAARASVQESSTNVNHSMIKSPLNGKIGIAQVKVGDIVNAGQTLVNTIVNDNPMFADFDVPQSRIGEFNGRSQQGTDGAHKFYLQFADSSKYDQQGHIFAINNTVDPQTGTIRIRLEFPNNNGWLQSGMSCVVVMEYNTSADQLAIPTKAMIQTLAETSVYTLGTGNVVQPRSIQPGPITDSMMIVRKGLTAGDRVIVEGLQKVRPGDTVNVQMQ